MKEIELWAGRDKDGKLYLYEKKPLKRGTAWIEPALPVGFCLRLDEALFPEIQWSDEKPTKVKLTICNNLS